MAWSTLLPSSMSDGLLVLAGLSFIASLAGLSTQESAKRSEDSGTTARVESDPERADAAVGFDHLSDSCGVVSATLRRFESA